MLPGGIPIGNQRAVVSVATQERRMPASDPLALDLVLFMDLAARTPSLRGLGIQEWLSFYFKDPDSAPGVYPEHDLFIQHMKLKNTLRHIMGESLITHLGLDYYGE